MDYESFLKCYVADFKCLEDEFIATDRYVFVDPKNYKTFSTRYLQIFLNACSSIDSLAEELCNMIDTETDDSLKHDNFLYRFIKIKTSFYKNIQNVRIEFNLLRININFHPFQKFEDTTGDWWQDYNSLKHSRSAFVKDTNNNQSNFELANLKNVIYSLAAYYFLIKIVNDYLLSKSAESPIINDNDISKYFSLNNS